MQKFKATILSTRPIDTELINNAARQNIKIEVLPFIETEAIDSLEVYDEIENILLQTAAVVFTSMNAVEAVASHLHDYKPDWKIYCIGNTTKKLVQEYFGDESIAADATDANELAEQIVEDGITGNVVFFCGNKRRDELPAVLNANDIEVNEIEVYQTNMLHHKIQKPYDAVLFFSPSAVQSFFSNNKLGEGTIPFAIGNTTANELRKHITNKIIIADEPGKSNLFIKAIEYFN